MNSNRMTRLCFGLLALTLAACGKTDVVTCPQGQIIVDNACLTPDANCTAGAPGSIASDCDSKHRQCYQDAEGALCGLCQNGYREVSQACVALKTCAQLDCASQNMNCTEAGTHVDAVCQGCVAGAVSTSDGRCVTPSCDPTVAGSTAQSCQSQNRACVMQPSGPSCGACIAGFVDDLGTCRPTKSCADQGCASANRACVPQGTNTDATCGGCLAGFTDQGGTCVANTSATCGTGTGSIEPGCTSENRTCVAGPPATCGDCVPGYFYDANAQACVPQQGCAQLDCATQHRDCSNTPYGHCTTCSSGYVQDATTGACRPPVTCAQLTCSGGSTCVEATSSADAYCQTSCATGQIWNGTTCQTCPSCDGTGENGVWPSATQNGYCICQTKPGYFYSVSADVGTYPCDGDGDGWVRESARGELNSTDPAIKTNARCSLRTINAFTLIDEAGESKTVPLTTPLALFESDRNDDDQALQSVLRQHGVPPYGARDLTAAELNRLTKFCFSPQADYNDNGVNDTEEYADHALAPNFRADQAPFNQFSYFAELNYGYFQPSSPGSSSGTYVIREKTRSNAASVAPADEVPVGYAPDAGSYWRTCTVMRDSAWATQNPPIGMDFAKNFDPDAGTTWAGMNHHSQFKCVEIEDPPNPALPSQITSAEAVAQGLVLNSCVANGSALVDAGNPAQTLDSCSLVDAATTQPGQVYWAAEPFDDYDKWGMYASVPDGTYVRGCVNECSEYAPQRCANWGANPSNPSAGIDCSYDASNFGKFISCGSHETCDGFDNDGDGVIDNGDPGGGQPCQIDGTQFPANSNACSTDSDCASMGSSYHCNQTTGHCGFTGICTAGTTHCQDTALPDGGTLAQIVCTANVAPGSRAETCNGADDNCNGQIDENDPGGGVQNCSVPGKLGACQAGKLSCQNGSLSLCVQKVFPAAYETCGNSVDENCDGQLDDAPTDGSCPGGNGFNTYYPDSDGDGFGNKSATGVCLCPSKAAGKVTDHRDCCDSDVNSNPNANTPQTSTNACGSWDWNCDGNITQYSNTSVTSGCGVACSGFCCGDAAWGWADSVPACGESHSWYNGDCGAWSSCPQHSDIRTQTCY